MDDLARTLALALHRLDADQAIADICGVGIGQVQKHYRTASPGSSFPSTVRLFQILCYGGPEITNRFLALIGQTGARQGVRLVDHIEAALIDVREARRSLAANHLSDQERAEAGVMARQLVQETAEFMGAAGVREVPQGECPDNVVAAPARPAAGER